MSGRNTTKALQERKLGGAISVLFATSEIAPWVKTGGLGDISAALPPALRRAGVDMRVLVPRYPALAKAFTDAPIVAELPGLGGALPPSQLRSAITPDGTPLLLLDCPALYERPGNPYLGADGRDWRDNHLRFGLLSHVGALLAGTGTPLPWRPQVLHCNDWQTALAPAYLHYLGGPGASAATLLTVHNLAFQGIFGRHTLSELALPVRAWAMDGVEYHGYLSFLKAGLQHADWITTVSPSYAREIQTDAEGMGLGGLLRWRGACLTGILNGIDTDIWNPSADPFLASGYDAAHLAKKSANKAALQRRLGLDERNDLPLLSVISRLTHQKGLDLLPPLCEALSALPVQLAVLGSGERDLEETISAMASKHPGQFAVQIGFDEGLAHLIEAGADIFLMPSRFEPCGLNQMYSLRYGTPPLVRTTGGLADTVVGYDKASQAAGTANGFVFPDATPEALLEAIRRAVAAWREPKLWRQLQRNGMALDWGWTGPATRYAELYRKLVGPDKP
ncbi:MAG: glycogen synthase GlgA [Proteobacteria bacterium]|nr:glycogen synthase GlgA [Pseudomonadota bacterium]